LKSYNNLTYQAYLLHVAVKQRPFPSHALSSAAIQPDL